MKLPLWKTWVSMNFYVVHTFEQVPGKVPSKTFVGNGTGTNRQRVRLPNFGDSTIKREHDPAQNRKESPRISVNQTRCVDISDIPNGQPFFVYATPYLGWNSVLCKTHHSNPNPWYVQQSRPYRDLMYEGWGSLQSARCEFKHER